MSSRVGRPGPKRRPPSDPCTLGRFGGLITGIKRHITEVVPENESLKSEHRELLSDWCSHAARSTPIQAPQNTPLHKHYGPTITTTTYECGSLSKH
ncbi:hypothetical protein Pcinc_042945 [Petrolisthes cinctipes]|uniref:Uncharacterized protein n=1 Tax=Petrolisthes cinctipes TaxID=88211 RepID=A0AAE1EIB7_PETCI|nr:hypothetical protein Pcinc_042945 [Petrolisthes cinctipes]